MPADQINYSEKYYDTKFEYRHVLLPPDLAAKVPKLHVMTESEWRNLGVQQSPGWIHYMIHQPEPHILLFRRPLNNTEKPTKKPTAVTGGELKGSDASKASEIFL